MSGPGGCPDATRFGDTFGNLSELEIKMTWGRGSEGGYRGHGPEMGQLFGLLLFT